MDFGAGAVADADTDTDTDAGTDDVGAVFSLMEEQLLSVGLAVLFDAGIARSAGVAIDTLLRLRGVALASSRCCLRSGEMRLEDFPESVDGEDEASVAVGVAISDLRRTRLRPLRNGVCISR